MLSRRLLRILSCRSVWGKEPEAVGYRGSLSLLRVPAGLLRAGACFAGRASGGQHIKGGQLFFQGCLYLSGDFLVEAFGGQTVLLVPGIFHLRHRGEQEKLLISCLSPIFPIISIIVQSTGKIKQIFLILVFENVILTDKFLKYYYNSL